MGKSREQITTRSAVYNNRVGCRRSMYLLLLLARKVDWESARCGLQAQPLRKTRWTSQQNVA